MQRDRDELCLCGPGAARAGRTLSRSPYMGKVNPPGLEVTMEELGHEELIGSAPGMRMMAGRGGQ